jgi:hypothetical protein
MPAAWLVVLSVVVLGGVTVRPPGNVLGSVTAMVCVPVSEVTGFTVTVTGVGPLCRLQVSVLEEGVRDNTAALDMSVVTVNEASAVPPARKAKEGVAALVTPVQAFASATLYTIPAAWLVVLRVVTLGGVTTRPPVNELGRVTTMV